MDKIYDQIIEGLRKFFHKNNFQHAVVGVSGGIDSAVTLKLAVDALGEKNVTGLIMPELNVTSEENIFHAKTLCEYLGVTIYYQPINSFLIDYGLIGWTQNTKALMNTKARIRMTLLYNYANTTNALVLGTSNLSETFLGYGTKYGDLAADIEVIGMLYKYDVYELAKYMDLPQELIEKAPSAELTAGQTDEGELGGSYEDIDPILIKYSEGKTADEIISDGHKPHLVRNVFQRIKFNKHKTEMPPVLKVNFDGIKRVIKKKEPEKPMAQEVEIETSIIKPNLQEEKELEKSQEIEENTVVNESQEQPPTLF